MDELTSGMATKSADQWKSKESLSRREEISAAGKYDIVIGIDEAGRGPLCGPVVAAACIVPHHNDLVIDGIVDSKKLTNEREREVIYENLISDKRVMWCASIVSNEEIDSINILQASLTAMRRATEGLIKKYGLKEISSCIALIDGNKIPDEMPVAAKFIIKGDGHIFSIAAASIIAKVTRDRIMIELDKKYPIYGLAKHKGYPTAAHRSVLYEHGPCDIYRMSYMPVKIAAEKMLMQQLLSKKKVDVHSDSSSGGNKTSRRKRNIEDVGLGLQGQVRNSLGADDTKRTMRTKPIATNRMSNPAEIKKKSRDVIVATMETKQTKRKETEVSTKKGPQSVATVGARRSERLRCRE